MNPDVPCVRVIGVKHLILGMFQGPQEPPFPISIPRVRVDELGGASARSQLWTPETGRCMVVLKGHTKPVTAVSWSTLGGHAAEEEGVAPCSVASASWDGTVRLWQRRTDERTGRDLWRCVRTLRDASVRACALYAVAWRPPRVGAPASHEDAGMDSTQLVSGGADGEHPRCRTIIPPRSTTQRLTGRLSAKSLLPIVYSSDTHVACSRSCDSSRTRTEIRRRHASSTSAQVWCGCGTQTPAGLRGRSRGTKGVSWRSPGVPTARV